MQEHKIFEKIIFFSAKKKQTSQRRLFQMNIRKDNGSAIYCCVLQIFLTPFGVHKGEKMKKAQFSQVILL